ncbi:MAG: M2 family metallopeptidase [Chitinophagales bacterium]
MKNWKYIIAILVLVVGVVAAVAARNPSETSQFKRFLKEHEARVRDLSRECNLAYFNASISGNDEDYEKVIDLEIKLDRIYADKEDFDELKAFNESKSIKDPLLKRQLDLLYLAYLGNQVDPQKMEAITRLQNKVEQTFSTYRADVGGRKLTDNELKEVLKTSNNNQELEEAWLGSKQIGQEVAGDVLKLVKMRNKTARDLGFKNYHEMQLRLAEQDPDEVETLFDELDRLTGDAYAKEKADMDKVLAERYGVSQDDLKPWHYTDPFFQEAPQLTDIDLDQYYADQNLPAVTRKFYAGLGMPINDLMKKSDLYEKPGKNQHAYCTDIDRNGDTRVVANVKPNSYWMDTMLHEFGHAAYFKYIDRDLPWLLREPAHTMTTEAVAMMFGRLDSDPVWMGEMTGLRPEEQTRIQEACQKQSRADALVFSRWSQVMYRFEKSMYENPDQDLNKLWWNLVEQYQLVKMPEGRDQPDWAAKIHIATAPAYYHNYLIADLYASQLSHHIRTRVLAPDGDYNSDPRIGEYLKKEVFEPGDRYPWDELVKRSTGEALTAKYYSQEFAQ